MRIARITALDELERLYRFRHRVYVDEMAWLPAQSNGLLVDAYDEHAYNYAAFDDEGEVIGSMRVVPDGPHGLPLERSAPLNGYRGNRRLVELCRLAVDSKCQGSRLAGLLMKAGYQRALIHGATHITLDTYVDDAATWAIYQKMGFEEIGAEYRDAYHLLSLPSVTLSLDLERAYREWPHSRLGLYRFFTSEDARIAHGD